MNTALQCLLSTTEFTHLFLRGFYKQELNVDNPLGKQGKIAEAFKLLTDEMHCHTDTLLPRLDQWGCPVHSFEPLHFKRAISDLNAGMFRGFEQQDCQELLNSVLDGIHEDLNRVKKRPEAAHVVGNGTHDAAVADGAWGIYKKQNDSFVVDTFQSQMRNRVTCNECHNTSVYFDPYRDVSVAFNRAGPPGSCHDVSVAEETTTTLGAMLQAFVAEEQLIGSNALRSVLKALRCVCARKLIACVMSRHVVQVPALQKRLRCLQAGAVVAILRHPYCAFEAVRCGRGQHALPPRHVCRRAAGRVRFFPLLCSGLSFQGSNQQISTVRHREPHRRVRVCFSDLFFVSCDHFVSLIPCSAEVGHYYAYCRPNDGEQWVEFNDGSVQHHVDSVITKAAYILFFRRISGASRTLEILRAEDQRCLDGSDWMNALQSEPVESLGAVCDGAADVLVDTDIERSLWRRLTIASLCIGASLADDNEPMVPAPGDDEVNLIDMQDNSELSLKERLSKLSLAIAADAAAKFQADDSDDDFE